MKKMKIKEFKFGILAAILGGISGCVLTFKTPKDDLWYSFFAGLVWAFLFFLTTELFRFHLSYEEEIEKWVDKKFQRIIEFIAISTKNGRFETVLKKLRDQNLGNLRWALAKFISHSLHKSFEGEDKVIKIQQVELSEYSDLLAELMSECRKSIYMTCPYTPKEWFSELNFDVCRNCSDASNCQKNKIMLYEVKERGRHLLAFFNSNVIEKFRMINPPDISFFKKENLRCINNFISFYENGREINIIDHYNIQHKIIAQKDLNPSNNDDLKQIIAKDFNVLDDKLVMMWDEYKDKPGKGTCTLILEPSKVENYVNIFQDKKKPDDRDFKKVLENIQQS